MSFGSSRFARVLVTLFAFVLAARAVSQSTWVGKPSAIINADANDNLTFAVNVPEGQSNELFLHMSAPAGQSYAAFGIGSQMRGTLMFVMYASGSGNNITLSPRIGTGHTQPQHSQDVEVELLAGSGIIDGTYVANAKCSNCRTWSGGSVDITSDDVDMVWAIGPTGNIDSDDLGATIRQHQTYGDFQINFAAAVGAPGVPIPDSSSNNTQVIGSGGSTGDGFRGSAFHAFLMVAAFLILFPAGYVGLRVFERVWLHWAIQSFALLLVAVGTGVGIAISKNKGISPDLNSYHQVLGFIIAGLLLMTWGVGLTGHIIFRRTGKPATVMKGHRVLGPLSISLGLANCFTGFRFAGNNRGLIVMLIATILMIIFVFSCVFFARRRKMRKGAMTTPAAYNFREGQMEPNPGAAPYGPNSPAMPGYGQGGIPLQSYQNNQPPMYR